MPSPNRRQYLATISSIASGFALAGCTSRFSDSPTHLRQLYVNNRRETAHHLTIQVVADEETEYQTEMDVAATDSMRQLPCEWPSEASSYAVTATLDSENETTATFNDGDEECVSIELTTEADHPLFMWISDCPSPIGDGEYCE